MNAVTDLKLKMSSLENDLFNKRVEYLKRIQAGAVHDELKKIFSEIKELEGKIKTTKQFFSDKESFFG
jgi:hypothetical protein